jgi:hypothetical protein
MGYFISLWPQRIFLGPRCFRDKGRTHVFVFEVDMNKVAESLAFRHQSEILDIRLLEQTSGNENSLCLVLEDILLQTNKVSRLVTHLQG